MTEDEIERRRVYRREWQRQDRAKDPEKYRARQRARWAGSLEVRKRSGEATALWRDQNRARHAASIEAWRKRNPEKVRAWRVERDLRKKYGLTVEQYNAMRDAQGQRCAICEQPFEDKPRAVHVDHCHRTGVVRGILCNPCNLGIGKLQDEPEILRRAADYIARHR